MERPGLERAVCLTGDVAHVVRAGEPRAACGTFPVLRLSRMGDWQAVWRAAAEGWDLCPACVEEVGRGPSAAS